MSTIGCPTHAEEFYDRRAEEFYDRRADVVCVAIETLALNVIYTIDNVLYSVDEVIYTVDV